MTNPGNRRVFRWTAIGFLAVGVVGTPAAQQAPASANASAGEPYRGSRGTPLA
jgi:hypothetical protein